MRPILFAVLALFATAAASPAQSCRSRSYSTYSYSYSPGYSYSTPYQSYAPTYAAPAVKKEYKEEVQYLKFLAVLPLVELPSYSAVYSPPVTPQGQAQAPRAASSQSQQFADQNVQILQALKNLDDSVRRLESRVENLERSGRYQAPPPKTAPAPEPIPKPPTKEEPTGKPTALTVNAQRCACCHQRGNESHGGDFVLSDEKGALLRLNDAQLVSMSRVLAKGKMPKINKRAQEHGITQPLTKEEAEALFGEVDRQIGLDRQ